MAEDALKLSCLLAAYTTAARAHAPLHIRAPYAWSIALYLPCDAISNRLAKATVPVQAEMRKLFATLHPMSLDVLEAPKEPKLREPKLTRRNLTAISRVADEGVEDASKFLCLAVQHHVGSLVGKFAILPWVAQIPFLPFADSVAKGVSMLYTLGNTASKYNSCNSYADKLGKMAQNATENTVALLHWATRVRITARALL